MCSKSIQMSLFDNFESENQTEQYNDVDLPQVILTQKIIDKLDIYTEEKYCNDIKTLGLETTWSYICQYIQNHNQLTNSFLNINNFGKMYEIGLAITSKQDKKKNGQYYTPEDVADVMSCWLEQVPGYNICDVACGTGNLILSYFKTIGEQKAKEILSEGRLYLYDSDRIALHICKSSIIARYGAEFTNTIHFCYCDFLAKKIILPKNCKVICNPPYSTITSTPISWDNTAILQDTKELYSAFMEKIINQSEGAVIITPYSFIGGTKFYSLRQLMNKHNGFIVSFDNVPGNIFNGHKHGVFNTNKSNSVRAAITVVENKENINGFKLSPLIRFKREERTSLLQNDVLESFILDKYQIVDTSNTKYYKCDKRLSHIWEIWCKKSTSTIGQYLTSAGCYSLFMPNTCRYYTTACARNLERQGQIRLCFANEDVFNYIFCIINSSFAYWYWRLYDGGITYPKGLLLNLPLFYELLSEDDKKFFAEIAKEMIDKADEYIVTKNNVGIQENIKYPRIYRDKINQRFLDILQINTSIDVFDLIHSNKALEAQK